MKLTIEETKKEILIQKESLLKKINMDKQDINNIQIKDIDEAMDFYWDDVIVDFNCSYNYIQGLLKGTGDSLEDMNFDLKTKEVIDTLLDF